MRSPLHRRAILATRFSFALAAVGMLALLLSASDGAPRLTSGALPLLALAVCVVAAIAPYRSDR